MNSVKCRLFLDKFTSRFRLATSFKGLSTLIVVHTLNYLIDTALFIKITAATHLFSVYQQSRLQTSITLLLNILPILLLVLFLSHFLPYINFTLIGICKLLLLLFIYPLIINNDFFIYRENIKFILIVLGSCYLLLNRLYIIAKTAFLSDAVAEQHRYIVNYIFNFFNFFAIAAGLIIGIASSKIHIFTVVLSTYLLLTILSIVKIFSSLSLRSIEMPPEGELRGVNLLSDSSLILPLTENIFFRILFGYLFSLSVYYHSSYTYLKYMSVALLIGSFLNLFIYKLHHRDPSTILDTVSALLVFGGTILIFTRPFVVIFSFSVILGCAYSFGRVLIDVILQRVLATSQSSRRLILIAQCDNLLQASWLFGIFLMLLTTSFASIKFSVYTLYAVSFFFFPLIIYLKLRSRN